MLRGWHGRKAGLGDVDKCITEDAMMDEQRIPGIFNITCASQYSSASQLCIKGQIYFP